MGAEKFKSIRLAYNTFEPWKGYWSVFTLLKDCEKLRNISWEEGYEFIRSVDSETTDEEFMRILEVHQFLLWYPRKCRESNSASEVRDLWSDRTIGECLYSS